MTDLAVIVATVGRPERLERLLETLSQQDLPPDRFELFVVIDGSHTESVEVLRRWREQLPQLRWQETGHRRGPAAARNVAWRATSGKIVAMTDDDCEPDAGWLSALLAAFEQDPELGVALGRTVTDRSRVTPFSHYVENHAGEGHQTCNSAYRRAVLEQLDGFDERFPAAYLEDTDLFCRATRVCRHQFVRDALVVHPPREAGIKDVARSALKFESDFIFYQKDPKLYRSRHEGRGPLVTVLLDVSIKYALKQVLIQGAWLRRRPLLFARYAWAMFLFAVNLWLHLPEFWFRHRDTGSGVGVLAGGKGA